MKLDNEKDGEKCPISKILILVALWSMLVVSTTIHFGVPRMPAPNVFFEKSSLTFDEQHPGDECYSMDENEITVKVDFDEIKQKNGTSRIIFNYEASEHDVFAFLRLYDPVSSMFAITHRQEVVYDVSHKVCNNEKVVIAVQPKITIIEKEPVLTGFLYTIKKLPSIKHLNVTP